jgi:hypothetical protein
MSYLTIKDLKQVIQDLPDNLPIRVTKQISDGRYYRCRVEVHEVRVWHNYAVKEIEPEYLLINGVMLFNQSIPT